jgi:hypothetical protein
MEFRNSQTGTNTRRYPEPTRPNGDNGLQGAAAGAPTQSNMRLSKRSGKRLPKIAMVAIATAVVAILAVGGWFAWFSMSNAGGVKTSQYQAVFLTNGQVYFCKLSDPQSTYIKCTDIFYLQVQQNVQPEDKDKAADKSQVSLAKLGGELHGPEDNMYISRQQVLFWENLKNDGKVVQAINSYKQQNK